MPNIHSLGLPRIGHKRELKFSLENYWRGDSTAQELDTTAQQLRQQRLQLQSNLDWHSVGDFSLYDHVLDTSVMLGNIPTRFEHDGSIPALDNYFRMARGRSTQASAPVSAGEMTKWFDTNYHYIVPEFSADTRFELNADKLLQEIAEARLLGAKPKPVILGPLTYLWLGKARDATDKLALLDVVLPVYEQLMLKLAQEDIEWLQIDEPALVLELTADWQAAYAAAYRRLGKLTPKILLTTYFGQLQDNLELACQLPVDGLHIDALNAFSEIERLPALLPDNKILSLGIINGRNIWKTNLTTTLDWLEPIHQQLQDRLWLAPSCSLLHVPMDLESETGLDHEIKSWLAFALQKLAELELISLALSQGRESVALQLQENKRALDARAASDRVHKTAVKSRCSQISPTMMQRNSHYPVRSQLQRKMLHLPRYPTTTIGSFPQTSEIRLLRKKNRQGELTQADYKKAMQTEIQHCIREQEACGLDVLVHGEAERNDMVEYFAEHLAGYAFTQFGWVQSYGSRCVKPPILYGDVSRPEPITLEWAQYAQSISDKPVKGMLTGPVTMLNWSFVRDDQSRRETCQQLALAIRDEVCDLEQVGINIIQIDEAALREGLPLRTSAWQEYLDWAVQCFKLTANGVTDHTQIHTHMCYSEFNDIIQAIADMDADVITIETSRSNMELLDVFDAFAYPNEIGPGVYDIHSPNTPSVDEIVSLMQKAAQRIPAERLWVNPDCGLKTRHWDEVKPALLNMVKAAKQLRAMT